jgi:hypothetical protein
MSLNPLAPVTDYPSMLNRIFWFTTAAALAAVWMLRACLPEVDALLARLDVLAAVGGGNVLPVRGGYFLPAIAVGMATRVFRLHARVSDWLGLREAFDVEVIMAAFAEQLGINLTRMGDAELRAARRGVMRNAFYPFVSGPAPAVDQQLVNQALDAWSWYWIGVEAVVVFTVAGFWLISGGAYQVGFQTLGGALGGAAFALPVLRGQCTRYAAAQVRAILAHPARAGAVREAFAELAGERQNLRLAA